MRAIKPSAAVRDTSIVNGAPRLSGGVEQCGAGFQRTVQPQTFTAGRQHPITGAHPAVGLQQLGVADCKASNSATARRARPAWSSILPASNKASSDVAPSNQVYRPPRNASETLMVVIAITACLTATSMFVRPDRKAARAER